MRFIFPMTGNTILRGGLQVRDLARIEVALRTDHVRMFACQLECKPIMVEIISIAVDTIMTGEAVRAEGEEVGLGEGNVDLAVAGLTGVRSECCYIAMMTIIAGKRNSSRCALMSG